MLQIEAKGTYADVIERALYNVITSSMALDGKHFFYVNPLEVWPEASKNNPGKQLLPLVNRTNRRSVDWPVVLGIYRMQW